MRCDKGIYWARDCFSHSSCVSRNLRRGQTPAPWVQARCFNCGKLKQFYRDCKFSSGPAFSRLRTCHQSWKTGRKGNTRPLKIRKIFISNSASWPQAKRAAIDSLKLDIKGSHALDISWPRTVSITIALCPYKLTFNIKWAITRGTVGFLMGRNSLTIKGISIHLEIINSDQVAEIILVISASTILIKERLWLRYYYSLLLCLAALKGMGRIEGFGSINPHASVNPLISSTEKLI